MGPITPSISREAGGAVGADDDNDEDEEEDRDEDEDEEDDPDYSEGKRRTASTRSLSPRTKSLPLRGLRSTGAGTDRTTTGRTRRRTTTTTWASGGRG
jgi:hypothetical protein